MYCEHCGKKIDIDSKYCEHCGKKVKRNLEIKKESKSRSISHENKIIIIILIIIGFVFLFCLELKFFNSPDNAIQNYLKNWETKNYDTILENLNIEKTKFTTKEIFSSVYPELQELNVIDFKVSGCEYGQNKNRAICHVTYKTEKNGLTYEKDYTLEKKEQNRLFLFADWEVLENDIKTTNDFLLYIPKGSTVFLISENLEEYRYMDEDKEGYDCYKIPLLFQGKYSLKIILSSGMSLEKEINTNKQTYTYNFNIKDASKELINEMEELGKNVTETIYNGVIKQLEFEALESPYEIKNLKSTYETLKKELEKTELTNFKIDEIKLINIEMKEKGNIYLSFRMNYNYDLKSDNKEHHGESSDTFYITLKSIDNKEIEKIDSLVTYFSKKY